MCKKNQFIPIYLYGWKSLSKVLRIINCVIIIYNRQYRGKLFLWIKFVIGTMRVKSSEKNYFWQCDKLRFKVKKKKKL